ncbi:MAG: hypothetical protein ACPGUD_12585 [Parashewanella sp.]
MKIIGYGIMTMLLVALSGHELGYHLYRPATENSGFDYFQLATTLACCIYFSLRFSLSIKAQQKDN